MASSASDAPFLSDLVAAVEGRAVQAKANSLDGDPSRVHAAARRGVAGAGHELPYLAQIQASFGHHDVTGVRAHTGGEAASAAEGIGARAFATGNNIAFAGQPDLHTAAHEAAHVVQQRSGAVRAKLEDGVGKDGDPFERHADRVADLVVSGQSAAEALDEMADPSGAASESIQLKAAQKKKKPTTTATVRGVSVVGNEAHAKLDKGARHGIVPGMTGRTSRVEMTVYEVRESSSKATTGAGLDSLQADRKVTDLKPPRESRKQRRRRAQAHVVDAFFEQLGKDGARFRVRVDEDWGFNTYWRVELLDDDGSARAKGSVVPADDYTERAELVFPLRDFSPRNMRARLIPYFDQEK